MLGYLVLLYCELLIDEIELEFVGMIFCFIEVYRWSCFLLNILGIDLVWFYISFIVNVCLMLGFLSGFFVGFFCKMMLIMCCFLIIEFVIFVVFFFGMKCLIVFKVVK